MEIDLGSVDEIPVGTMREYAAGERRVLIVHSEGALSALQAICSHAYFDLVQGDLDGDVLTCSMHFSEFNVVTGEVLGGPAEDPLETYPVRTANGRILVEIDPLTAS